MVFEKKTKDERERLDLEGRVDMFADYLYQRKIFATVMNEAPAKKEGEHDLVLKISEFYDENMTLNDLKKIIQEVNPNIVRDGVATWKYAIYKNKHRSN